MGTWRWLFVSLVWLFFLAFLSSVHAVNVSTPAEFLSALKSGESSLFLVANISGGDPVNSTDAARQAAWLSQGTPAPESCIASPDAFTSTCLNDPELVVVRTPTVVTGLPGVYIDLAQIRRMVTLVADLTFSNLTIYGVLSDVIPFAWFFLFAENSNVVLDNCVIESPCGQQPAFYMLQYIQKVDPSATFKIPGGASAYFTATTGVELNAEAQLSSDTVPGSLSFQVLQNGTLVCDPSLIDNTIPMDTYVNPNDNCQNASDMGFEYRGTVNVTRSGYTCQDWSSQTPQYHTRLPSTYPAAGLVLNYCRNPDNSDTGAWCYTINGPRWEGCDIPYCTPGSAASKWTASGWRLWVVLAAALLALLGAALAAVVLLRRGRRQRRAEPQQLSSKSYSVDHASKASGRAASLHALTTSRDNSGDAQQPFAELRAAIAAMGSNDQQLLIQDVVGKGGFGVVYRGIWRGLEVAIKTVTFQDRKVAGGSAQQRAIAEAAITFSLSHPNVVATYHHDIKPLQPVPSSGSSLSVHGDDTTWKLYLVQEFCAHGSLRNAIDANLFLTRNLQPKLIQCVQCLLDVAQGVKYIHSKHIIHGDLNPSNVLLKRRQQSEASSPRSRDRSSTRGSSATRSRLPSRGHTSDAGASGTSSELPSHSHTRASELDEACVDSRVDEAMAPWEYIAKVCDFGLSMKIDVNQAHVSNAKQGTPFYIAPEVRVEGQLSMAADVHAFGVMMWECFHSKAPYRVTKAHKLVKRREFPKYPRDCPLSYAVLSSSCLSPNPKNRPNFWQIVGVLSELSAYLQGFNVDESTRFAHITLEELDKLSPAQAAASAPESMASAPLTQAAVALNSIMMSAPEPDITYMSEVSCPGDGQEVVPDGTAFTSLIHSIVADDADGPQSLVSRVYYNAATPGGALAPIADEEQSDSSLEGPLEGAHLFRPRSAILAPRPPPLLGPKSAASSSMSSGKASSKLSSRSSRSQRSDADDCVVQVGRFGSRRPSSTYAQPPAMGAPLHHQLIPPTSYVSSSLASRASAPTSEIAEVQRAVATATAAPEAEAAGSPGGSFLEARSTFSDDHEA